MPDTPRSGQAPIAIVGMGALMPGATDTDAFWRLVVEGRDLITEVPRTYWLVEDHYDPDPAAVDKTYCRRGAFLPQVEFDPMTYGIPPNALEGTDSTQLLALLVAEQVLGDATEGGSRPLDRERASVILGCGQTKLFGEMESRMRRPLWLTALREYGLAEPAAQRICDRIADLHVPWQEASFPGLLGNVVAGRIANRFDLHGTNCTTDAACAASIAALSMAVDELTLGRADTVIAGGVDASNEIGAFMCFSKTPALSPTGDCRPFSAAADGTMLGEGIVMFALRRLSDAERDGDRIYAVIRGIGSSSDGHGAAIYAPVPEGQARALRRAYAAAGYDLATVALVEAHGTGTPAGDAAEVAALLQVAEESGRADRQWCALGSIKSQVGHTKGAAGAAGLFKAALALHHRILPPTIKVDRPNPALGLEGSPFYLNTRARPWVHAAPHPRRASVSSFGFGGTNFHVALEEYVPGNGGRAAWRSRTAPSELVLLSAPSPQELITRIGRISARLTEDRRTITDLAQYTQGGFRSDDHARLAIVAADPAGLAGELDRAAELIGERPSADFCTPTGTHYRTGPADPGRIAFLFPGQGSQYLDMSGDLTMQFPAAQALWDRIDPLVAADEPLSRVVFPVPAFTEEDLANQRRRLTATEWAQPALAAHSLVLLDLLRSLNLRPDCVAGHSFGELVALHAAGVVDTDTLIHLARRRGELMRDTAMAPGTMLAVAANRPNVEAVLQSCGTVEVWIANHNAPEQLVLSGTLDDLETVRQKLATEGIAATRLDTAAAFHSPLVAAATEPFLQVLRDIDVQTPRLEVYGNADAGLYPADADTIRKRVATHLSAPVRFADQIEAMHDAGVRTFLEVGAGTTLTGLVGQILADRPHRAIALDRRGRNGVTSLHHALAELTAGGISLDLAALWASYRPAREPLTDRRPTATVEVCGANYGRRYPLPDGAAEPLPEAGPTAGTTDDPALPEQQQRPPELTQFDPAPSEFGRPPEPDHRQGGPEVSHIDPGWFQIIQESQRQTAETYAVYQAAMADYQRSMADGHLAYLRTAEASFTLLNTIFNGGNGNGNGNGSGATALPDLPDGLFAPVFEPPAAPMPLPGAPTASVEAAPSLTPPAIPGSTQEEQEVTDVDIEALLLSAVADQTGYPVEMLEPGMDLESDLGIDSIKRVQILSAVRTAIPAISNADPGQQSGLGKLRTIGAVAAALRDLVPAKALPGDPATTGPAPDEQHRSHNGVTRLAVRTVEEQAPGLPMAGLDRGVLVTEDGGGVAPLVVDLLAERGVYAEVVSAIPEQARAVVFLGGLRDVSSAAEEAAVQQEAFRAARAMAPMLAAKGGIFVTVQSTGGDFGLSGSDPAGAWRGGLAALARTAAKEWPRASIKAIDCAHSSREAMAAAIVGELTTGGATLDVGLSGTAGRVTLMTVPTTVAADRARSLGDEPVIVATGGARGVTAAALLALAQEQRLRLVLIGRTALIDEDEESSGAGSEQELIRALAEQDRRRTGSVPSLAELAPRARRVLDAREVRATLAALEQTGAAVRYVCLDVRDGPAVATALAEVRRVWGPITGVVHGAGVLADRHLADKTDEQFDQVFGTKIEGLRSLLAATEPDPLRLLCVFSSVAAWYGNPGQCDYAMANEVLGQVAAVESRKRPDCLVRAIAWGPWDGGMVTPSLAAHLRERQLPLIPLPEGARAFADELVHGSGDTSIIITADAGGEQP